MKKFIAFASCYPSRRHILSNPLNSLFEEIPHYRMYDNQEEFNAPERTLLLERLRPSTHKGYVFLYEVKQLSDYDLELTLVQTVEYEVATSQRYLVLTEKEKTTLDLLNDLKDRIDKASSCLEPLLLDSKTHTRTEGRLERFVVVFTEYFYLRDDEKVKSSTYDSVINRKIFSRSDKNELVGEPTKLMQWKMLDPKVKIMFSIQESPVVTHTTPLPELRED